MIVQNGNKMPGSGGGDVTSLGEYVDVTAIGQTFLGELATQSTEKLGRFLRLRHGEEQEAWSETRLIQPAHHWFSSLSCDGAGETHTASPQLSQSLSKLLGVCLKLIDSFKDYRF